MQYTIDDLMEIMDEEVVIVGTFASGKITGTLEEIMGDSGILFIGGKSISISEITEVYLFDDSGETYLYDPFEENEEDESGVFSIHQFIAILNENVIITIIKDDGEQVINGKVVNVNLDTQTLIIDHDEPIGFNVVITIKIIDSSGKVIELVPENYMSAFEDEEDEQYVVSQFYPLLKNHVRVVIIVDDIELEIKGILHKIHPDGVGFIELKEQKGNKIPVPDILDFFVITNNGDEQFLVPLFQGSDFNFSSYDLGDGIGYYSPDILQYLVNRNIKLKGDFEGKYQIKGLLIEVNEALFKLDNNSKDYIIEDISGVFVQDSKGKWDLVPPVTFEHRNQLSGAYEPQLLEWLVSKKVTFTIGLLQGGVVELSGYVKSLNKDNFTITIAEGNTELEFPFIMDMYLIDENGLLRFINPKSGIAEDRSLFKYSENELLSILMRNVKLEGSFVDNTILEGLVIKCNYIKGYLTMSNAPNHLIPIIDIKKYFMLSN